MTAYKNRTATLKNSKAKSKGNAATQVYSEALKYKGRAKDKAAATKKKNATIKKARSISKGRSKAGTLTRNKKKK